MFPLSRSSLLACGFAAALSTPAWAEEAVQQKFGTWTVTVQPGVHGSSPREERASPIRLVSQQDAAPADAVEAFPVPQPPATATTEQPPAPQSPDQVTQSADQAPRAQVNIVPADLPGPVSLVQLYSQVYNTIPFSRAEYVANPSYRHDATMEFLFGQLRPMTINRSTTVIKQRAGGMPGGFGYPGYSPYGFNSYYYPFYNNGPYWTYNLW